MTAREKFKELGYDIADEYHDESRDYLLYSSAKYDFISFTKSAYGLFWCAYYSDDDVDEVLTLNGEETKAVIMQLQELGWLE